MHWQMENDLQCVAAAACSPLNYNSAFGVLCLR